MRAFVAVDVEPHAREGPIRAGEGHLTLHFLGEVDPGSVEELVRRLTPVGQEVAPFAARLEGVGAFPSARDPRVVWLGATEGREAFVDLAARVREALRGIGATAAEAFVPHVTLFRVRSERDRQAARDLLEGRLPSPPPRSLFVHAFALKESRLGPGGAVHRTLASFPLRGGTTIT